MAKMKKLLFVIMMCVAVVANAQSWSKDLEKKAKKGDVTSQIAVANAYAAGDGVKLDLDKAAKWYYAAAKQGNKVATVKLYSFYSKELEKLVKEGDVQAQYEVALCYLNGVARYNAHEMSAAIAMKHKCFKHLVYIFA